MKTLEQWNRDRALAHEALRKSMEPHANGIACPKCGSELWDTNPMMTLTSNPPQKNVNCPTCGWNGYRLA